MPLIDTSDLYTITPKAIITLSIADPIADCNCRLLIDQ